MTNRAYNMVFRKTESVASYFLIHHKQIFVSRKFKNKNLQRNKKKKK